MKKQFLLVLCLALLAPSTFAQWTQSEWDLGVADTLDFEVVGYPDPAAGKYMLRLDLYLFNDADTYFGGTVGFKWEDPNMHLDSAVATALQQEETARTVLVYPDGDFDAANATQTFIFGFYKIVESGIIPGPERIHRASWFFSIPDSDWNVGDDIVFDFDTTLVAPQLPLLFVPKENIDARVLPYWGGPKHFVIKCCTSMPGNIDDDPNGVVDIADLTNLINHLYIGFDPLISPYAGDLNCDLGVDVGDVTTLIDNLFINYEPIPDECTFEAPKPSVAKVELRVFFDGENSYLSLNTDSEVRGLQFELTSAGQPELNLLADPSLEVFSGGHDGRRVVGMFDIDGKVTLSAGEHRLLSVKGPVDIENVVVSDANHTSVVASVVTGESILPQSFALAQNHPNPFNPTTTISYSLSRASRVKLEVFNVTGQRVAVLVDSDQEAGQHEVVWDARSDNGEGVGSGVYFYRLTAGENVSAKKMLLLK